MNEIDFRKGFEALTGNEPFPWQEAMYHRLATDDIPDSCNLPTGLGKTSIIPIWLMALANSFPNVPRRLVYVVNRRTVVDQATDEAIKFRKRLLEPESDSPAAAVVAIRQRLAESLRSLAAFPGDPLAISTLRGQFADNREWSADPARPAVIVGTVDMIGSRLLFSGYGIGFKLKPLHAGFLGQDVLLVHDEAHLEPAFQDLLIAVKAEQKRCQEFRPFHVMEMTATSRGAGKQFELTEVEKNPPEVLPDPPTEPFHHVWRRLKAKKALRFQATKRNEVAKQIGVLARRWKASGQAVLVYVRTLDDVKAVRQALTDKKEGVADDQVLLLTGTLRGRERDRMAKKPIFARFLLKPSQESRTVYLVCTSAGEVGVDISADHMVCDLSTLDSMAQRLGRVNRRGDGAAEIDVVYETDPDPKRIDNPLEAARWKTFDILRRLKSCDWIESKSDGSPHALRELALSDDERKAAFAPKPITLATSSILFDAWALTTIKGKLPGRPPVEPYLHGLAEWEPPETQVAWRSEVDCITGDQLTMHTPADLLDDYPLKPIELLRDRTSRVIDQLEAIAKREAKNVDPEKRWFAWVVEPDGTVNNVLPIAELVDKASRTKPLIELDGRIVLLPPVAGGLEGGMLNGESEYKREGQDYDVADEWGATPELQTRVRIVDTDAELDSKTRGMRLIRAIAIPSTEEAEGEARSWLWFERPESGDSDGSQTYCHPVSWDTHTSDVVERVGPIVENLPLTGRLRRLMILVARFHDLGKKRAIWQLSIGNRMPREPKPEHWLAKSGTGNDGRLMKPIEITRYRHEFGSLLDAEREAEFESLDSDQQDLLLHLIAAHHGRGRPHFPMEETFDLERLPGEAARIANEVPRRFARLQRRYGRWGLAYLESLLRAADYAASANPSPAAEVRG